MTLISSIWHFIFLSITTRNKKKKKKKKSVYYKIIQKIEGEHFIKSNYFKYFIPNNLKKKKYLRVGMCPPWPYTGSAHAHMGFHSTHDIYDLPKMESRQVINQKLLVIGSWCSFSSYNLRVLLTSALKVMVKKSFNTSTVLFYRK